MTRWVWSTGLLVAAACGSEGPPADDASAPAPAPVATLTRTASEPPGAHCAAGGVAVLSGRDLDRDGVLGDDEVEHAEYTCGDVLSQSVTVHSSEEAAALASITVIHGDLTIDPVTSMDGVITLPALQHLDGSLRVQNNAHVVGIQLPALSDVTGSLLLWTNARLATFDAPKLQRSGSLVVQVNPSLQALGLAGLQQVDRDVVIEDNTLLASLEVPVTELGGTLQVRRNPALERLEWSFHDRLARAIIDGNAITALRISVSSQGGQPTSLGNLQISNNPLLTEIDVGADQVQGVVIINSDRLTRASFRIATADGSVLITSAPKLETLEIRGAQPDAPVALREGLAVLAPIQTLLGPAQGLDVAGGCIFDRTQLTSLRLGRVDGVLRIARNARLTSNVTVGELNGGLQLEDNPVIDDVRFARPAAIHGDVTISGNAALARVEMLEAVTTIEGSLVIDRNAQLHTLAMPAITTATAMTVTHNHALPSCQVAQIFARIPQAARTQADNDDAGSCP